jgi:hypothetical protein
MLANLCLALLATANLASAFVSTPFKDFSGLYQSSIRSRKLGLGISNHKLHSRAVSGFRINAVNLLHCSAKGYGENEAKKVVVVGAGPAGLAVAHYLLQRTEPYDITVIDRRADPRTSIEASIRSYSLGLGVRGRTALKMLPPYVWQGVRERGVECDK